MKVRTGTDVIQQVGPSEIRVPRGRGQSGIGETLIGQSRAPVLKNRRANYDVSQKGKSVFDRQNADRDQVVAGECRSGKIGDDLVHCAGG